MATSQSIGPGDGDEHRMPRWVKGFIIAAVAAVVVIVAALAIGDGAHGPSRHLPDGDQDTTPTPERHTPPVDHG